MKHTIHFRTNETHTACGAKHMFWNGVLVMWAVNCLDCHHALLKKAIKEEKEKRC